MSENICVVLGGSFNPPTRAHKSLMESAIAQLDAASGVYVPSSDFYVRRKANRAGTPHVFTEKERFNMLQAMCGESISVSACEYGDTSKGRTLQTLDELQHSQPGRRLYFVMGCDKMTVFHKWKTADELLTRHNILWVGRNGKELNKALDESQFLRKHAAHMAFMAPPNETESVSSTRFWRNIKTNPAAARSLLAPEVWEIASKILS